MKAALIIIALILCAALIGWITFDSTGDRASVNIETQEIKQDTKKAVKKGKDLIDDAKQEIRKDQKETQPVID